MLKRLAILAVAALFAISVSSQQSKGTTKKESARTANSQRESQNTDQSTQKSTTPVVQVSSPRTDAPEANKKNDTDEKLANYTLWLAIFTGVLVLVSGVQGYFLFTHAGHLEGLAQAAGANAAAIERQANTMDTQAGHMNRQAELMDRQLAEMKTASEIAKENTEAARVNAMASEVSAVAAEKSAEAALAQIRAMKDRERARLVIQVVGVPEILPPEQIANGAHPLIVHLFVANTGPTKAFGSRAYAILNVVGNERGGPYQIGFQQELMAIIGNTENDASLPRIDVSGIGMDHRTHLHIVPAIVEQVREGTLFVQVSGMLLFTDIYDDTHEQPFRYVWVPGNMSHAGAWPYDSKWYDVGVTKAAVEADRQPDDKNQKPN